MNIEKNIDEELKLLPFVSIVIPCLNEENFIAKCLDSLITNDYPKTHTEIIIVDGISKDKTRETVEQYKLKHSFIRLVDNPKVTAPSAMNIGINNARGSVIMIMGAHAVYEKNYITNCVKYLDEYKADNVGGAIMTLPKTDSYFSKPIVIALSHKFGIGGSTFRTISKEPRWVDTVFGGCYRKEVFDKIGLFNEHLSSSQDIELNIRLKKSGGKILLHPEIISYYYTRSDLRSFCKNNFRNGMWTTYPLKFVAHMPVSIRHFIPLAFVLGLISSVLFALLSDYFLYLFLAIIGSYVLVNGYFSIKIALVEKNIKYLFIMPFIFATLHIVYGLGSLCGILKAIVSIEFWKNRFKK